jgi:hypothetical protein
MNDNNKLNRLEELKDKLFNRSYQTKIEHRDSYSRPHASTVTDSWEAKEKPLQTNAENFFMQTSRFKKFFIFSVIFFLFTIGYGAYVFFAGGNTVSNDNIDISILGNNFTAGGEQLPLIIGITNRNSTALDLVDLVMEYPKGSTSDSSGDVERLRVSLGTIPAGAVLNKNLNVVLFGQQGSIRTIKISLEYRVKGSNAIFVKEKTYDVNISSTPISLTVDAPVTISPNQSITLNIKETLNATKPSPKTLLKLVYPVGFQFVSSTPVPSFGNNVWNLGDLAPGAEHDITITGKMIDVFDGEEKTFNISSGSQSPTDKSAIGVVYNSILHTITVNKAFVEASLFINGVPQTQYAIDAQTPISAEIRYVNNLDTKVDDLQVQAKISGNAFNRQTIFVQQGFYDSSKDTITWDKSSMGQLAELDPGESGSVTFSVSPLSLFSTKGGILANPSINIEVSVAGKQSVQGSEINELNNSSSAIVRIISDVGFAAKALYYSGPFTNTGPIPPKAEQPTTYAVVWTLTNTSNSISNTQIKSTLPPWVSFVGHVSPASEDVTYNSSTKQITWNVDRIPKGTGITGAARTASFQISFTPSLSQVGTTPNIVNDAVLTGHDDFANVDVRVSKSALDARLDGDPTFPVSGGVVAQ